MTQRQLLHGYYASVSYADAQIGKVLESLDRLKLTRTPLWFCGETMDGILAITESGSSTPTMSRPIESRSFPGVPGVTRANSSTHQLAETVDLFPYAG